MSNTRLASHHPLRITNFCQVHVRFSLGEVSCKGSSRNPREIVNENPRSCGISIKVRAAVV